MEKIWFEGSNSIDCSIQEVKQLLANHGQFFSGAVSHMPGLSSIEILEQGPDYVTIRTNEGLMKRTNLVIQLHDDVLKVEFDEEYQAGRMVTARSHFLHDFRASEQGITHRISISDVKAPGFLGFFYEKFGSSSIGSALLKSFKAFLEKPGNDTHGRGQ